MLLVLLVPLIISLKSVYSLEKTALDQSCVSLETYHNSDSQQYFNVPSSSLENESFVFNFSSSMNGQLFLSEIGRINRYEISLNSDEVEIKKMSNRKTLFVNVQNITNIFSWTEWAQLSVTKKNSNISINFLNNNKKWSTLISLKDTNPFNIKLVSFTSSEMNNPSKWIFNCKGSRTTNVPPLERLKNKILSIQDHHLVPVPSINTLSLNASFNLHYLSLNAKESLLITSGKFNLSWFDPGMQWDPNEYGNITSFNLLHQEIWLPDFVLLNSHDQEASLSEKDVIKISNRGKIIWSPKAKLVTWCKLHLKKWPLDTQTCIISFGLQSQSNYIGFSLPSEQIKADLFFKNPEWKFISLTGKNKTNYWKITIELERKARTLIYTFVYTTIACVFTTLVGFWLPIYISKRLYLHTASLFILLVNSIALDSALPAYLSSTPYLIIFNSHLLLLNILHLIFCTYFISKVKCYYKSSSKIVERITTNPFILTLFCLSHDPQYYRLKESKWTTGEDSRQIIKQWAMFGNMVDRILLILTIIYIYFMIEFHI